MRELVKIELTGGAAIFLEEGNITRQRTDAIVNAANSSLMGGGGVDGAIHRAGGPAILEACKKVVAAQGRLPTGQAVATTGGRLAAGYVIHTVGPIWRGGDHDEPELLASCYRESLRLADKMHLVRIAFPSISTGAYGYPMEDAAEIALRTVMDELNTARHTREARFVLFGADAYQTYANAADKLIAAHKGAQIHIIRLNDTREVPE